MYVDEVELTEIAAYDETYKYRQLEPSKMQNYKEDDQVQLLSSSNNASQKRLKAQAIAQKKNQ